MCIIWFSQFLLVNTLSSQRYRKQKTFLLFCTNQTHFISKASWKVLEIFYCYRTADSSEWKHLEYSDCCSGEICFSWPSKSKVRSDAAFESKQKSLNHLLWIKQNKNLWIICFGCFWQKVSYLNFAISAKLNLNGIWNSIKVQQPTPKALSYIVYVYVKSSCTQIYTF